MLNGVFLSVGAPPPDGIVSDDDRRMLAVQGKAVSWRRLNRIAHIATAQTIRRWHRKLIGIARTKTGGIPQTSPVVEALVVKMAVENSYGNDSWGRRRIAGAHLALGHDLDAGTVRNSLRRHRIPLAPNRGRGRNNDLQMVVETPAEVAIDFAQTIVIDASRICRLYVLLAIHTPTREAALVGITEHPIEAWMVQCARNLTMAEVGFLQLTKAASIQMDHDAIFTAHFRKTLADTDLDVRFTPCQQPWKKGHIERFIQPLKNLVLRKFIFHSGNALREAILIWLRYYNQERPLQALDNRPPMPPSSSAPDTSKPII